MTYRRTTVNYIVVSSAEFTYPGITSYPSAALSADVFAARGGYASFQLLLQEMISHRVSIHFSNLPEGVTPELYSLRSVMVERNHGISEDNRKPHWPERTAPFRVYDCLRPFDGTVDSESENSQGGLYVALKVDRNAVPGTYPFSMIVNGLSIPGQLEIYKAMIPEESLTIVVGYSRDPLTEWHGVVPGTPAFEAMERKYLSAFRRMHQNMMYVSGIRAKEISPNEWTFDYTELVNTIHAYRTAGIKYFRLPHVGLRKSWGESTILLNGSIPAMSYEGYCYLTQYLHSLRDVLNELGCLDNCILPVNDEPNQHNATEYRALCGLVHRIFPEIRLCDAMSYGNFHGAVDIWIPLNSEYEKHRAEIETFRQNGAEIWHYVCCVPREYGYINRFLDYPLLSTRYLHWGNYKYDLKGFLHWAANRYQPGQNPFETSCPEHRNADSVCYLPAGDTHIVYPGTDGPWISMRLEAERESAEEYEMLKSLAETDKEQADEICGSVFHSFRDVEYDVRVFLQAKRRLLTALSARD